MHDDRSDSELPPAPPVTRGDSSGPVLDYARAEEGVTVMAVVKVLGLGFAVIVASRLAWMLLPFLLLWLVAGAAVVPAVVGAFFISVLLEVVLEPPLERWMKRKRVK